MKVVAHHSEQKLERLASREKRADLAKRLRAVLLAKQGFTAPEVATCTGFSRRAVQDGVARYTLEHPVAAADFLAVDRRARQAKPLIELAVFREVASIDINA